MQRLRKPDRSAADEITSTGSGQGSSSSLPYLQELQPAFAPHRLDGVQSRVGPGELVGRDGSALAAARGNRVEFAETPDKHTAAHEAAHVVQQRRGIHRQLSTSALEQHADVVADSALRGEAVGHHFGLHAAAHNVDGQLSGTSVDAPVQFKQRKSPPPGTHQLRTIAKPSGPKSSKVPDMVASEEQAIDAAIKRGDHQGAIDLTLTAMYRIDSSQFNSALLEGGRCGTRGSGSSTTEAGNKTRAFYEQILKDYAKAKYKDENRVSSFSQDDVDAAFGQGHIPSADQVDARVKISAAHCNNVPNLYGTMRHEFVHVHQYTNSPKTAVSDGDLPHRLRPPKGAMSNAQSELPAYLDTGVNYDKIGLKADTWASFRTWDMLTEIKSIFDANKQTMSEEQQRQYLTAFQNTWTGTVQGLPAFANELQTMFNQIPVGTVVPFAIKITTMHNGVQNLFKLGQFAKYGVDINKYAASIRSAFAVLDTLKNSLGTGKDSGKRIR